MDFCDFKNNLIDLAGKKVYVGFSGGADSMALLLILKKLHAIGDYQLEVVHFEHGIRGEESRSEAEFVKSFCAKHKLKLQVFELEVLENKRLDESLESCARRLRQTKFAELIGNEFENSIVALGHHLNDGVENLFLHLVRGGNVSSLVNPSKWSEINRIKYYRMLLPFRRDEIEDFLRKEGENVYCMDSSNHDNSILRNLFRNEILPKIADVLPNSFAGLAKSYEVLTLDANFINNYAKSEYQKIANLKLISNDYWANLDEAILIRVLRYYLSCELGEHFIPDYDFIKKFRTVLLKSKSCNSKKVELGREHFYVRKNNFWQIIERTEEDATPEDFVWDFLETPEVEYNGALVKARVLEEIPSWGELKNTPLTCGYFDMNELGERLYLTGRRAGDKIDSFGGHRCKVKKLLIDAKLPLKEQLKLIYFRRINQDIIFISDLKQSKIAEVTKKSRKIIEIRVEKI